MAFFKHISKSSSLLLRFFLLLPFFSLLRWNTFLQLLLLLCRYLVQGTLHLCESHVRQGQPPHLSGVLGLNHIPEHGLTDQMLQMLFHPFHHPLLLPVSFIISRFACGQMVYSVVWFVWLLNWLRMLTGVDKLVSPSKISSSRSTSMASAACLNQELCCFCLLL